MFPFLNLLLLGSNAARDAKKCSKSYCISLELWKKSRALFDLSGSTQSSAFIKLWPVTRLLCCSAVTRLFAALTTMGGLLAWRQQITSRKRDERAFQISHFHQPASKPLASLMNANLWWKIWEILSSCFFAERWPVLLPPEKNVAEAGASVIYLLTIYLFITFLFAIKK